jgi:hypothetical protein
MNIDLILEIDKDTGTVYRFNDIALMAGVTNFKSLGKLLNPCKGI